MGHEAGVHVGHYGAALQKGLHIGADVGGVHGGAQDEGVCLGDFGEDFLELVVMVHAVPFAATGPAGFAGFDDGAAELDQFGLQAGCPALLQYCIQQNRCVAVSPGAAIDCDYFHCNTPLSVFCCDCLPWHGPGRCCGCAVNKGLAKDRVTSILHG